MRLELNQTITISIEMRLSVGLRSNITISIVTIYHNYHYSYSKMTPGYLNRRVGSPQTPTRLQSYRLHNHQQGSFALLANGNSLQLHRLLQQGLALQHTFTFSATIVSFEILPSQHHSSDYIWILD